MSFIKKSADITPIVDTVFAVVKQAAEAKQKYGADNVIDATIGSLYNEENQIVAMKSVFKNLEHIAPEVKAKYAGGFKGNENYRETVKKWVVGETQLHSSVIATPGGTGAVNLTVELMLEAGETLVIPEIAWGSYAVMANNRGIKIAKYEMFQGEHFHLDSFKEVCSEVMKQQHKLVVIINDPCHNPTGYSLAKSEWEEVIAFLNEQSKQGEVILLNDIAYIDYSYQREQAREYMQLFNEISEKVLVVIAFSCSKTMTSYGLRCGAAILLGKDQQEVQISEDCFAKAARAIWSNVNNGAMENFVEVVTTHHDEFMAEKEYYIQLLKQRSDIVVEEAKEIGLVLYPYQEGFFVTVKMENNELRDRYHAALIDHQIFTVKVNKGIRIAICSLSVNKCYGLAKRMKQILDEVKK